MSVASQSRSIFTIPEPKNAKHVFGRVVAYLFEDIAARLGAVSFVQVGANDGRHGDHLHAHLRTGHWRGLLIEPLPEVFSRLKQTYAGIPGLEFANLAIAPQDGTATFHAVADPWTMMSSFSLETILLHRHSRPGIVDAITEISVPTRRLDSLLGERGQGVPDVIAIDAEGYDDVVLSTIDFARQAPRLLLFEHVALSAESTLRWKERLEASGYTLIFDRHDLIAVRHGLWPAHEVDFLREVVEATRLP